MDFIQCQKCSEYVLADSGACINCGASLPPDAWAERRGLRRALETGNFTEDLIEQVSPYFELKKARNVMLVCAHLALALAAIYLYLQPILIPMPLGIASFFLFPAGILTCGLQATSIAKFIVPRGDLYLTQGFDYLVLGLGLMVSAGLALYLDPGPTTPALSTNLLVFGLPLAVLLVYRLVFKGASFVVKSEGVLLEGEDFLVPYSDIVFAYPVSVGIVTYQSNPNSWDVRIKLKPEARKPESSADLRGDTLIISTLKYGYLASVVMAKLRQFNCPERGTITETWSRPNESRAK